MTDITETSQTVAAGQLRSLIERIERVEAEIKDLNADKSEIYTEARGVGFDVKAIRQCVAARKLDSAEREERDAIFDLYWSALGGASHVHVHEERNSTAPDRNGANTENDHVDRSALRAGHAGQSVNALSGQIEPRNSDVEKFDGNASLAAREGEKPLHSNSHSPSPSQAQTAKPEAVAPASGNISPDPRLSVGSDGDPSTPSPEADGAKMEGSSPPDRAAQAGMQGVNSGQAVTTPNEDVPAFLLKDRQPSPAPNPDCQNPKSCRWSHSQASCAKCATDAVLARQRGRAA